MQSFGMRANGGVHIVQLWVLLIWKDVVRMRKLMITMQNDYDATNDITNPTMRMIYAHMKKGKTYTRKQIVKELGLPSPTVTARVSDLLILSKACPLAP